MLYSKSRNHIFWSRSGIFGLFLSGLPLVSFGSLPSPAAEPPLVAQASPEFSDVGRPRRRQGGGSRGSCLIADKPPLTALVPDGSTGYTLAASPSFWFYLPYSLNDRHLLEFVLKDSQDNLVHRQTIAGDKTAAGIVNLRLPAAVALDPNQSYEWYLLVQCDAASAERFVFVNGAIRRLERPELQQQVATLAASDQTELYRSQNIWYDALDQAAIQVQAAPQDRQTRQNWRLLLQSIGLEGLATEPIISCCTSE